MSNLSPTNPPNNVSARSVDLSAEVRKLWGVQWSQPSPAYEFSSGRKFELRTGDASVYETSQDFG
jgi:hypothetical protein